MNTSISAAAATLGRKGGLVRSEAKTEACRQRALRRAEKESEGADQRNKSTRNLLALPFKTKRPSAIDCMLPIHQVEFFPL